VKLRARRPNLNAFAARLVRSVRQERLRMVIRPGERHLREIISEYGEYYHRERNHQGIGNKLIAPIGANMVSDRSVKCRERLGGMLKYYHREAT
jgi:putative transposase